MEELESILVNVKAWAGRLLESLGLCRSDCEALKGDKAALEIEVARLTEQLNTSFPTVGPLPVVVPEAPGFGLGPILAMIGEFKAQIEAIKHDADNRHGEIAASQTELRNSLVVLSDKVVDLSRRTIPDLSGLPGFMGSVNDFMAYVKTKLSRLPF